MKKYFEDYGLDRFDQVFVVGTLVYAVFYMAYAIKKIYECINIFKS